MTDYNSGQLDNSLALDLMTILGVTASLNAAHSTGLWDLALCRSGTAAEFARELQLCERATEKVLRVLAAVGGIERQGHRFGSDAATGSASGRAGGASVRPLPATMIAVLREQFSHTSKFLRTGEPLNWMDGSLQQRESSYRGVVSDLGMMYETIALSLAASLGLRPQRILDIGCGSGVWSLAFASRDPSSQVSGLDFPGVLDAFEARAARQGLRDRITLIPGDMHEVQVPAATFDLVIVANVLRLELAARAQAVVERAAAALRPGGHLLVIDALAAGTPAKELVRAVYELHLTMRTEKGHVYSAAQIAQWMHSASMTDVREIDCGLHVTAIGALLGTRL